MNKSYFCSTSVDFSFSPENLRDRLAAMAESHGEHVAFVVEPNNGLELTYGELERRVECLARNLLRLGLKRGDRLAFQLPNTAETIVILYACAYIGVISVPVDLSRLAYDLAYILRKANPSVFILMSSFRGVSYLRVLADACPHLKRAAKADRFDDGIDKLRHVVLIRRLWNVNVDLDVFDADDVDLDAMWTFEDICQENPELSSIPVELPYIDSNEPGFMLFTSGTTGKRKGAMTTFFKYMNNSELMLDQFGMEATDWLSPSCNTFSMNFVVVPLTSLMPTLSHPIRTIFPSFQRDIDDTLRSIERHKCVSFLSAPKFILDVLSTPRLARYDLSSLRYIFASSQIVSPDLVELAFAKLPNLHSFLVLYGMSEILSATALTIRRRDHLTPSGRLRDELRFCIGKPFSYLKCKIIEPESGRIVPFNQCGELYVKGYSVMDGYWQDIDKTKETFDSDGWFKTGDIVRMNEQGYIYYVNRLKDMMIIDDVKLYPSEIEAFLRTHPNIAEAAVFALTRPDGYDGDMCAWVILVDETSPTTTEDIHKFCWRQLNPKRAPRYIKIVDDFPLGVTGKVLKTEMARIYQQELNEKL